MVNFPFNRSDKKRNDRATQRRQMTAPSKGGGERSEGDSTAAQKKEGWKFPSPFGVGAAFLHLLWMVLLPPLLLLGGAVLTPLPCWVVLPSLPPNLGSWCFLPPSLWPMRLSSASSGWGRQEEKQQHPQEEGQKQHHPKEEEVKGHHPTEERKGKHHHPKGPPDDPVRQNHKKWHLPKEKALWQR